MKDRQVKIILSWLVLLIAGAIYYYYSSFVLALIASIIVVPLRHGLYNDERIAVVISENNIVGTIAVLLFICGLAYMAYTINSLGNYKSVGGKDVFITFTPLLFLYLWRDVKNFNLKPNH